MKQISFVEYDPNLDDYAKNHPNPFPEKMASAIASIEKHEIAVKSYINQRTEKLKSPRSSLQEELLNIYSFDPTEQQLQQLKTFMAQLFADKLWETKTKNQAEIVA
jgi:3',5'-cyclic AMP phosphodiesterase CpdA